VVDPSRARRRPAARPVDIMPSVAPRMPESSNSTALPRVPVERTPFRTQPDAHGLYRIYPHQPSYVPDLHLGLDDLCDAPGFDVPRAPPVVPQQLDIGIVQRILLKLIGWFYETPTKSINNFQSLVDTLTEEPFDTAELQDVKVAEELKKIDASPAFLAGSGWKQGVVEIPLPCPYVQCPEDEAPKLEIPGIWHRSWRDVIVETFTGAHFDKIHLTPFELHQQRPDKPDTRVHWEVYDSDAMLEEHNKIREEQDAKGNKMETVVAAIMNWSDSTHLAQFGSASLWPLYTAFGNITKYVRNKPKSYLYNHMAYIPSVRTVPCYRCTQLTVDAQLSNDDFLKYGTHFNGRRPSDKLKTQLKRELFHGTMGMLIDDDFMDAYENGIKITFADGITRLVFPRFISYSADYPERYVTSCVSDIYTLTMLQRHHFHCPSQGTVSLRTVLHAQGQDLRYGYRT
jgi:hypothetical protein